MQEIHGFVDPERHATAMREVVETIIFTADDGQQFSGRHLNRDFPDNPLIVRPNAWRCAASNPEQMYSAYQYAAAHPEYPVVVLDMPSHGQSDNLTGSQRHEIYHKRSLELLAAAQAQAVYNRLTRTTETIAVGDSLGARVAIDLAHKAGELGVKPLAFIGFDVVGLEERKSAALTVAFFGTEWRKTEKLYRTPENQELENAYEIGFKNELAEIGYSDNFSLIDIYRQDLRLLGYLVTKSPLASDTGVAAIEKLLTDYPDVQVSIVIGGLSSICRLRNIDPVARKLQTLFGERMSFDVWPKDGHGMSVAPQQPRMATYVRSKIKDYAS